MTIYDAGPLAAGPLCGLLKIQIRIWEFRGQNPHCKELSLKNWDFHRSEPYTKPYSLCPITVTVLNPSRIY